MASILCVMFSKVIPPVKLLLIPLCFLLELLYFIFKDVKNAWNERSLKTNFLFHLQFWSSLFPVL